MTSANYTALVAEDQRRKAEFMQLHAGHESMHAEMMMVLILTVFSSQVTTTTFMSISILTSLSQLLPTIIFTNCIQTCLPACIVLVEKKLLRELSAGYVIGHVAYSSLLCRNSCVNSHVD